LDKEHGRIDLREIWTAPTDPQSVGLAGVAQLVRVRCKSETIRKGKLVKQSDEVRFAVTSFWPREAEPETLLRIARDHWSIENGQHYRRDRTQDEDRCPVRHTTTARNLSLFRTLAIFLFKQQARNKGGKKSLPDFEKQGHRNPWSMIHRLI
jgi:predicted transposase YbfD/YdcC